jgi:hypothetical protein
MLNLKTEIREKPQIARISQITEAKEVITENDKNSPKAKKNHGKCPDSFLL